MSAIAIQGYMDVEVLIDPVRFGFWLQVGENPEARRFVGAKELVDVGTATLALPEDARQWVRNCLAYQREMPTYPREPSP